MVLPKYKKLKRDKEGGRVEEGRGKGEGNRLIITEFIYEVHKTWCFCIKHLKK